MLWRRAIQRDAITGMAVGIFVMSFVVFAKQMMPGSQSSLRVVGEFLGYVSPNLVKLLASVSTISFPWFVLIGTSVTMGIGILSSFTHPAPTDGDRWK
jgi:hypothetical protein